MQVCIGGGDQRPVLLVFSLSVAQVIRERESIELV